MSHNKPDKQAAIYDYGSIFHSSNDLPCCYIKTGNAVLLRVHGNTKDELEIHAKRIVDALNEKAASEWISVESKLPEQCHYVIVFTELGQRFSAVLFKGSWFSSSGVPFQARITHWMELPEGPEVAK